VSFCEQGKKFVDLVKDKQVVSFCQQGNKFVDLVQDTDRL
jgi:hypothetical protein